MPDTRIKHAGNGNPARVWYYLVQLLQHRGQCEVRKQHDLQYGLLQALQHALQHLQYGGVSLGVSLSVH